MVPASDGALLCGQRNALRADLGHAAAMPEYSSAWPTADTLDELARRQDDVVGRPQLHRLGVTRDQVRSQVRARRWRIVGRRVVVLHRGPLSPRQREWVAVLSAGPRSALGGLTAAAHHGLVGFASPTVHVIMSRGAGAPPCPGVVVHRSRVFVPERDVQPDRLPPRTRLPRSLVDAATWSTSPAYACGLLAAAVQQRLTSAAKLRAELEPRPAARHRRLLLAALHDIEGGAQSFAEIDAARLCRRAGLPPPTRQAVRTDGQGRRRYLDLFWDPPGLCVEIDGRFHMREDQWRLDLDRQNEIVIDHVRTLRFPVLTVRLEPDRFTDQIARALGPAASIALVPQTRRR